MITPSYEAARTLASDISFFADSEVLLLPDDDNEPLSYEAGNRDMMIERLRVMEAFSRGAGCIAVTSAASSVKRLPPAGVWRRAGLTVRTGGDIDIRRLMTDLVDMGYERVPMVYASGQFSVRGDIIDIFTPYEEMPCRIELFDTEAESIRTFDVESQRSVAKRDSLTVMPANIVIRDYEAFARAEKRIRREYASMPERIDALLDDMQNMTNVRNLEPYMEDLYEDACHIWDYMKDGIVIVDDPNRAYEALEAREREAAGDVTAMVEDGRAVKSDTRLYPGVGDFLDVYGQDRIWLFTPLSERVKGVKTLRALEHVTCRQMLSYNGKMDLLEDDLNHYVNNGYDVTIVCSTEDRFTNMTDFISRSGLAGRVRVSSGQLSAGMDFPEEKICYISDSDIFGTRKIRRRRRNFGENAEPIKQFSDISPGDFVVHEAYGIGRYAGLKQLTILGEQRDFMEIKYAGRDILYVPAEQMDLIQKYIAPDNAQPRVNKMSGREWKNTKAKAKAAVAGMADELLKIQAERKSRQGWAFSPDTVWQKEFEDSFPYEETPDQLRCIDEIKKDMESPVPMDRLLCGDVGYGKTEVAARAIFKCAADGKQAAMLVPTTILASQHYNTLKERFEKFPFRVALMSRFRTDAEIGDTIRGLKDGSVDIVIGTHRLLSSDVEFKDLGLLVVDEEQRFGVRHKEAIKKLKANIDVLTLSATPIPRTLHMSLLGLRDMSIISEPPDNRYPVQTYVMEEEDHVIAEAVRRELDRGGQVFCVYNRINGIFGIAEKIKKLVPEAAVCVGHGRMEERRLEDVMMSFQAGEYNVLVATTIIENGIDIPNANTLIVFDADRFGLSQLYQIRGRVGRTNRMAYAYLLHKSGKALSEVAVKRLQAIRDFTEFGAGFKIAMRDLEIRGAGNILGSEQSGHIVNVGYELYCKLVDDAVRAIRGEVVTGEREETQIDIRVSALIPADYIPDETTKLQYYRRIADISSEQDEASMRDELADVFGEVPQETLNLIRIARIKAAAGELGISKVQQRGSELTLYYGRGRSGRGAGAGQGSGHSVRPAKIKLDNKKPYLDQILEILIMLVRKSEQSENR